ncbi:hypothetical protein SDC9_157766 [bioreactor metagenome]|uniref:Phage tail protein I n=1 Tax=bioreactor metagenome TaxID=1076179 RepID=A0A645F841_9ZZZZ
MSDLENVKLIDTLPPNLAADELIQNLCPVIDAKLQEISNKINVILLWQNMDLLPEAIVDELAWQFHVDFYDYKTTKSKKITLVKKAIPWHKIKGTPAAVEAVCTEVFKSAQVIENWEYGGEPYRFRVGKITESISSQTIIDSLVRTINQTKNTRSWLDGLIFYRKIDGGIYYGFALNAHKRINIYPSAFRAKNVNGVFSFASGQILHRKVEIK